MAVLGLRFCARAFSSCGERGPLFIAVRRPLTLAASPVAEHRLQTRRLSSCGSRAQLLHGMWDLPRPGLEPVSPALAGRFSTTAPPGKPKNMKFFKPLIVALFCWVCYRRSSMSLFSVYFFSFFFSQLTPAHPFLLLLLSIIIQYILFIYVICITNCIYRKNRNIGVNQQGH